MYLSKSEVEALIPRMKAAYPHARVYAETRTMYSVSEYRIVIEHLLCAAHISDKAEAMEYARQGEIEQQRLKDLGWI